MSIFAHANRKPNESSGKTVVDKWGAVWEAVIVTFLITLTSKLIELGRFPTCLDELWMPFLASFLMALYAYVRARGMEIEEDD